MNPRLFPSLCTRPDANTWPTRCGIVSCVQVFMSHMGTESKPKEKNATMIKTKEVTDMISK